MKDCANNENVKQGSLLSVSSVLWVIKWRVDYVSKAMMEVAYFK